MRRIFLISLRVIFPMEIKVPTLPGEWGLDWSICMTIIKAHNGRMEAENRKEGGSVFRFSLPLKGSE
jgi:two-component system sensor histidine kinase KdpD